MFCSAKTTGLRISRLTRYRSPLLSKNRWSLSSLTSAAMFGSYSPSRAFSTALPSMSVPKICISRTMWFSSMHSFKTMATE